MLFSSSLYTRPLMGVGCRWEGNLAFNWGGRSQSLFLRCYFTRGGQRRFSGNSISIPQQTDEIPEALLRLPRIAADVPLVQYSKVWERRHVQRLPCASAQGREYTALVDARVHCPGCF